MIFKKTQERAEVVPIREIKSQRDVVRELSIIKKKGSLTKSEADKTFREIGSRLNSIPLSEEVESHILITIDGIPYDITLKPAGNRLTLSIVKHHQDG